jgi:SAM-dependent methyltransferase
LLRRIFGFNQEERDRWVKRIAKTVPAGSRVLDIGAGPCPYRRFFDHCEYKSQDFAQLDETQLEAGYGEIDYVGDIAAIPVPDRSFDAILCTEVLEHVPDPVGAIREMARILRPGGQLILTAPLGSGLHQQPYHFYGGFTPFWYRRFLGEAGFEQIAIEPNGGFFKFYGQESQRFQTMLNPRRFRGGARLVAALAWIAAYPIFRIAIPLICDRLDSSDPTPAFTVGYHVTAVRSGN